jgi:peptidoglycan hydrolase CwlO-like protein
MMQSTMLTVLCFAPLVQGSALSLQTNPIEKVIEMMSELQQKIIKEGEAAQKIYDEFAEWCEDESKNLQFEIKTGKAQAEELTATIEKAVSDIKAGEEKIEELAKKIAQAESDLKAATEIREKEHGDFLAIEAELVDTVDALERAIGILEREMAKTGGAFLQVKNADSIVSALRLLVQSASISSSDGARLTAFLQSQQESGDGDAEFGAPDPAVYKSKSGGIVDVLNDLLADAEGQLEDARKKESNLQNNYEMLKLELEDAIKFGGQEMDKTKKANAACEETKAEAEGDLEVTNKSRRGHQATC